jgi:type II secretion system protein N
MTPTTSAALSRIAVGLRGNGRALLGYAAFTLVIFIVALAATLPHELIVRRALDDATQGLPLRVAFESASYAPPNGYRFSALRLLPVDADGRSIDVDRLTVRVPLLALLQGRSRTMTFHGDAYGGEISGGVTDLGTQFTSELSAEGVDLERLSSSWIPSPGRITGRGSVSAELSGDGRTTQSSQGQILLSTKDLGMDKLSVQGLLLPDLRFSEVTLRAEVHGTRLQVEELRARGDEVSGGLKGDVLLRQPTAQSVLNLQVQLDVSPQARPGLRVATALLPQRPAGSTAPYTLRGTLAAPVLR